MVKTDLICWIQSEKYQGNHKEKWGKKQSKQLATTTQKETGSEPLVIKDKPIHTRMPCSELFMLSYCTLTTSNCQSTLESLPNELNSKQELNKIL